MERQKLEEIRESLGAAAINVDNIPRLGVVGMDIVKTQINSALEVVEAELNESRQANFDGPEDNGCS